MTDAALIGAIYVDADACLVKREVYRVAERHSAVVHVVSNATIVPSPAAPSRSPIANAPPSCRPCTRRSCSCVDGGDRRYYTRWPQVDCGAS